VDLTRYLLVCGGLIALTLGLAWGLRRLFSGALQRRAGQRSLQLLELLPLGGKRQLGVVRCQDRSFLIGLGEREVHPIAELTSPGDPSPASRPANRNGPQARAAELFTLALERASQAGHNGEPPLRGSRQASWAAREGLLS
jgi:flagellar biogenesis protein FliO